MPGRMMGQNTGQKMGQKMGRNRALPLAALLLLGALAGGGCEGDDAPGADVASGRDVADGPADTAQPAPDPLTCELADWGYGEVWDGTVDTPAEGPEPEGLEGILEAHNAVRRFVGVPELSWSAGLAADAQAWADNLADTRNCGLMHDVGAGQGENLAAGGGTNFDLTAQGVVGGWSCEREDWDNEALTCLGEPGFGEFPRSCGHYTQVVWRDTTEVGCGLAICRGFYITRVFVCRYLPQGNFVGRAPY